MIITIDGPTASGKSSVSRVLASRLGYYYLYTGLLYRAIAYLLIIHEQETIETIAHADLEKVRALVNSERLSYRYDPQDQEQIFFDGINITCHLKDPIVDQAASILSTNNQVRELLNQLQRSIAQKVHVVIDGRDAGSVVFPHAEHKFFLTADQQERALRWYHEQRARGNDITLEQARESIAARDARDSSRDHAPLIIPEGAKTIDTSGITIVDAVQKIVEML